MNFFNLGELVPLNTLRHWNRIIMENADGEFWSHEGWSGEPAEPYRHWCKFPALKGVYSEIWHFIEPDLDIRGLHPERLIVNAYNHGDSSWVHTDSDKPNHWTVIVYLNDVWDINWGGETIFIQNGGEFTHCVSPTPGRVVLFDGRIPHGPRAVTREAPLPRLGLTYQCIENVL